MLETNKRLNAQYLNLLQNSREFHIISQSKQEDLSGLFLAGIDDNYEGSQSKIMIVGREPRGWGKQYKDENLLSHYIEVQTKKAHDYLRDRRDLRRGERGSSFHNFIRDLSKQCNQSSFVWANLHCYSWKGNRTDKSPLSREIDTLSHELLKVQIDVLRPQYIIFAHGVASHSIELRRSIFPIDKCNTQLDPAFKEISNKQLWKFEYPWERDYKITCFRIQHPSSFSYESKTARKFLIEYFKGQLIENNLQKTSSV